MGRPVKSSENRRGQWGKGAPSLLEASLDDAEAQVANLGAEL